MKLKPRLNPWLTGTALIGITIAWSAASHACTVIAVGKDASTDGSVIVTHANDGMRDFRIVRVPGKRYSKNSARPVFYDYPANGYLPEYGGVPYLRYVGKDRGSTYDTGQNPNIPIGTIPQVRETYTYYEATYPIMNEKQVIIGETTCKSKITPMPSTKRLFYSSELARVVLERCDNARDGVILIGELIETYGYHGTGECLVVADDQEIWVVEMCGYAEDETSGLWVAQRVPDDEVFVSSNLFRIRDVDPDSENMMCSSNLFEVCQELGWWDPAEGTLDWLKAVGDGEYHHPYYSLRRVWRIFDRVKPSANYPAKVSGWLTTAYPFSIKPDEKLSVKDVMALHRDVYQDTDFDLTKGVAAQAFGDPNRFDIQSDVGVTGAFERSISYYRCNYVGVKQARSWMPDAAGGLMWMGLNQADRNCFIPIHVGARKMPKTLDHGDFMNPDFECAWWVFYQVCATISRRYDKAIIDVETLRGQLEAESFEKLEELEHGITSPSDKVSIGKLTRFTNDRTEAIVTAWRNLWSQLQVKYLKNYLVDDDGETKTLGYPDAWLEKCGYEDGPTAY